MEKIWFKSYHPSIKHEVDVDALGTIVDVFNHAAEKFADRPAYTSVKTTISYRQTKEYVDQFTSFLQNELHLKKGDRMAVMMANLLQYPVVVFGALQAGVIVVNTNPLYTSEEMKHQLLDSGANTVVIMENFASTFEKIKDEVRVKNVIIVRVGDLLHGLWGVGLNFVLKYVARQIPQYDLPGHILFKDLIKKGRKELKKPVKLSNQDIALLQYTGGTTGVAKGAMLTHRNVCANLVQAAEWVSPKLGSNECMVTPLPLYHIFSFTVNLMIMCYLGGHSVMIINPRDTKKFISQLRRKDLKITAITCVNTLFNSLVHHPDFKKVDFSGWKLSLGGGAAVQRNVADQWQEITGTPIVEAYGLTETSPGVCVNPVTITHYTGSVGLPLPSTDISIRNEQGNELPIGESGILWVKGPQVMKGYWDAPEETKKTIQDGWLDTGDIAKIDENGYVKIVDRKKDLIIVSGFNVYPNEIEDVLTRDPRILSAAVIGVPDEKSGEVVKAFIVAKDKSLTKKDVVKYARKYLTGYKIPKHVEFRDHLPETAVGKILRRQLSVEDQENHKEEYEKIIQDRG